MKLFTSLLCVTAFFFYCSKEKATAYDAAVEKEPIIVKLATENQLIPIFLTKFQSINAHFDDPYLKQLEKVLAFDLDHNGMTQRVAISDAKKRQASNPSFDNQEELASWKALSVFYVIKGSVEGNQLSIQMLCVNNSSIKTTEPIVLSGNFNQDRRQMHKVADRIHKALFNVDGIASTRVIYTIKLESKEGRKSKPSAEVWEADYDGGNAQQITQEHSLCVTPAYIPPKVGHSCGSFFYVCYRTGQPKIYLNSLKGGESQRLTYLGGNQLMPAISKQRDQVAFISDATGNPDLFLQAFDPEKGALGKPRQIFTTFKATQGSPTFSPEGDRIAFVSNKDGSPRIYVLSIPAPTTSLKEVKAKLITKHGKESTAPAWSPDGKKLAYTSMTEGVRQIWIHNMETHEERQVTQGPGHKENPTWAPNSLHLIFNSVSASGSELYLINLNQPEATQITSGSGIKRFPSWEAREN